MEGKDSIEPTKNPLRYWECHNMAMIVKLVLIAGLLQFRANKTHFNAKCEQQSDVDDVIMSNCIL